PCRRRRPHLRQWPGPSARYGHRTNSRGRERGSCLLLLFGLNAAAQQRLDLMYGPIGGPPRPASGESSVHRSSTAQDGWFPQLLTTNCTLSAATRARVYWNGRSCVSTLTLSTTSTGNPAA